MFKKNCNVDRKFCMRNSHTKHNFVFSINQVGVNLEIRIYKVIFGDPHTLSLLSLSKFPNL